MKKRFSLYCIISSVGLIIRQNLLPTPAEALGLSVFSVVDLFHIFDDIPHFFIIITGLPGTAVNIILENILHIITFAITGLIYSSEDNPATGSFLYLIFYIINIGILTLFSVIPFVWWTVLLAAVGYAAIFVGITALKNIFIS